MAQFEKQTLIQGKKLYEAGKVVQLTYHGNKVNARVIDGKNYIVNFTINKNNKISQRKCSCQQQNCIHQAAAAYAFNAMKDASIQTENSQHDNVKKSKAKPAKKEPLNSQIPDNLSLDKYFLEIKKTAKRERDIYQPFMKELDKRLLNAMSQKDAVKQVTQSIEDFYKITNYPKNYRNKVINKFKQTIEKLLEDRDNYKDIFTWLLNNRIRMNYQEFDEYFKRSMNYVDIRYCYEQIYLHLFNNDLTNNPYLQDLLEIYFVSVRELKMNLSKALIDIVKYKDQMIYKYYEIKNLMNHDKIEDAQKAYNRIAQKKDPLMIQIKEELDSYKKNLDDEMDEILRTINRKRNLKDIQTLVAQFKRTCGKEWQDYKELFLNQLAQVTTESQYVSILAQEKEWYLPAQKVINVKGMYTFNKYKDILKNNNKEAYYLLYMCCLEEEIQNTGNGRYSFVIDSLRNLIHVQGLREDVVENMIYDLQAHFPTRKALIRDLDEFMDGGFYSV